MALEWSTTSQVNVQQGVKCIVYGGSGEGKTSLCATAPRPVVISAEAGLLSLSRANIERMYGVGQPHISYDIPVLTVRNMAQLKEAYNFFADPRQGAQNHFSTVCLDSLTEIAEVILANAKLGVKDPRQAYGQLIEEMVGEVRKFRDLFGYNFYGTCKMELMKDETAGVVKYMPAMPGSKLGPALPYYFDEVLRIGTNKTQEGRKYRYLQTQPDIQYVAKDRSGVLDEIEQPDLTVIFNKIRGV